jgi:anaerobic selenocysteine-containing dehydrogenase
MGLEHQANSIQALHAHYILSAITGNIDIPGGDIFPSPYPNLIHEQEIAAHDRLSTQQIEKPWGSTVFVSCPDKVMMPSSPTFKGLGQGRE